MSNVIRISLLFLVIAWTLHMIYVYLRFGAFITDFAIESGYRWLMIGVLFSGLSWQLPSALKGGLLGLLVGFGTGLTLKTLGQPALVLILAPAVHVGIGTMTGFVVGKLLESGPTEPASE